MSFFFGNRVSGASSGVFAFATAFAVGLFFTGDAERDDDRLRSRLVAPDGTLLAALLVVTLTAADGPLEGAADPAAEFTTEHALDFTADPTRDSARDAGRLFAADGTALLAFELAALPAADDPPLPAREPAALDA